MVSLMEAAFSDEKYKKYKIKIKKWEKEFKDLNKRNPTKDDFRSASDDIRNAYKMYWLWKTSILERSILDDDVDSGTKQDSEFVRQSKTKLERSSTEKVASPLETIESNSVDNVESDKVTVWGIHLNKPPLKTSAPVPMKKSSSFAFTKKLFAGSSFKKRNPLKSFRSKSADLTFVETIDDSSQSQSCDRIEVGENKMEELTFSNKLKITGIKAAFVQPVNIMQKMLDSEIHKLSNSKLNEGWLERCNTKCSFDSSSIHSNPNSVDSFERENISTGLNSDDDYVYSSEDENSKLQKTFQRTKSFSDDSTSNCIIRNPSLSSVELESVGIKPLEPVSAAVLSQVSKFETTNIRVEPTAVAKRKSDEVDKPTKKIKASRLTVEEEKKLLTLKKKLASGTANDNFVAINLKKKIFARGRKTMTGSKYKKQQWKMKKKLLNGGEAPGVMKCYKCGDVGHFSRQCKKLDILLPPSDEGSEEESSPFPTIEEAADMAKEMKNKLNYVNKLVDKAQSQNFETDEYCTELIESLYKVNENGRVTETPQEVFDALKIFGHTNFRSNQEKTVMRILSGQSTLLISSTGSGKSLCYQLPAYLYAKHFSCITLVISPLVSLMDDQVIGLPSMLKAECLHTNQTEEHRAKIIEKLKNHEISLLLVSPEAVVNGDRGIFGRHFFQNLPAIAFACIDEVHCVSQWSHNFRTSYLMICKILKERFKVKTLLGLTATATRSTIDSVRLHLGLSDAEAVIAETPLPANLTLSTSRDKHRDEALITLLTEKPFSEYGSIVVYCIRRNECERVASFIRTTLQNLRTNTVKTRGALSEEAEPYHAGLSAARRKRVQKSFMSGKLRIVVATVAFGMGINKADIRGIIHYNIPPTFEHYVQEVGRAGRDGLPSRCHLFLDSEGNDICELKRHIYANSLDRYTICRLLQNVFKSCSCVGECRKHEIAFSVEDTVKSLDLPQENISTILCYLELAPEKYIQVLPPAYVTCTVHSYSGQTALKKAAKQCPPLAVAIAQGSKSSPNKAISKLEFSVVSLADQILWDSGAVKYQLKNCEWTRVDDKPKKSGISVNFSDLGFRVKSVGNLTAKELDDTLDSLFNKMQSQERLALRNLHYTLDSLESVSFLCVEDCILSSETITKSDDLKKLINKYFAEEIEETESLQKVSNSLKNENDIISSIRRLLASYKDVRFSGRTIAKIFHGIESPNFPALLWSRSPFWRCGLQENFNVLVRVATKELLSFR